MKIENWKLKIADFVRDNKIELIALGLILLLGAFFRLYKISLYMTFLGDEGRDVIIVRRFLTELHPPLIGPGTSVGNMYLGPLYYYMMAPALLLANFSPVGPAVQIAILGVVTIFFVWFVAREWFGKIAGLVAAGLYAISPTVIVFSRSSWNPNIMPFFALLSMYSIWKVWNDKKYNWLIILGLSFAFVMQSHYLGLLLVPTIFVIWVLSCKNSKLKVKNLIQKSILGASVFLGLMSPLLIFDIRHNWLNFSGIKTFFTSSKDIGLPISAYFSKILSVIDMIFTNLIAGKNLYLGVLVATASALFLIWLFKKRRFGPSYILVFLWLIFGLFGIAFYRGQIYDHYLGFLFPVPFFLIGAIFQNIIKSKNKIAKVALVIVISCITYISVKNNPPFVNPTYQMPRAISVAKVIQEKANGERFNLATISDLNNRDVYQYFLMIWGAKVVDTDPSSLAFTVTDQLFVVCEMPREKCNPVNNPSAWITNFGWTKIVDEWDVWGGTLFKLGHAK